MKTGVFVVGALREIELCSGSWRVPYTADWHLLTWSRTTDRFRVGSYGADLNVLHDIDVKFNSIHVFDKSSEYGVDKEADPQTYWALQGPWFWKKIHAMYPGYDRYVILRPDLFLWPKPGKGVWPEHVKKLHTLGRGQDQMFLADYSGMSFLSGVFDYIRMRAGQHPSIHYYLDQFLCPAPNLDMGVEHELLGNEFYYTLARPNSRNLARMSGYTYSREVIAKEVFRRTAEWWDAYNEMPYEGVKDLP